MPVMLLIKEFLLLISLLLVVEDLAPNWRINSSKMDIKW